MVAKNAWGKYVSWAPNYVVSLLLMFFLTRFLPRRNQGQKDSSRIDVGRKQ